MSDARTLTDTLRGRRYGRYGLVFCPAHNNTRTPAFSLANAGDGRLLAKCFAGCSFSEIVEALRGLPFGMTKLDIGHDGDRPGQNAACALAARAIFEGIATRILALPDGHALSGVARGVAA